MPRSAARAGGGVVVIPASERGEPSIAGRDRQCEDLIWAGDVGDDGRRVDVIAEQPLRAGQADRPSCGAMGDALNVGSESGDGRALAPASDR